MNLEDPEENLINKELIFLSDGAPQFNIFNHALCWIHVERLLRKIVPKNDAEAKLIEETLKSFWLFYKDLKLYKEAPQYESIKILSEKFDEIFSKKTGNSQLDAVLKNIFSKKSMLLKVLEYPFTPLHNNGSERDIRESVIKRKIFGGTRSQPDRKLRDVLTGLAKTCRKLGISFWEYLEDRISGLNKIPYVPDLIRQKSLLLSGP